MAATLASSDATACFQRCYKKLMVFVFKEDDGTKATLNLLLDELIALDCNSLSVNSESVNNLLKKLCILVPIKYQRLVTKVCHVVHNFVRHKMVSPGMGEMSREVAEFMIRALKESPEWGVADTLRAIAILMEEHYHPFLQHQELLVGREGILISLLDSATPDASTVWDATHCIRCLAFRTTEKEGLSRDNAARCFSTLLSLLHKLPAQELYHNLQCRVTVDSLQGIQSLLVNAKVDSEPCLGQLLAAVKGYMVHGLGQQMAIPPQLFPTFTSAPMSKSPKGAAATAAPSQGEGQHQKPSAQPTPSSSKARGKKNRKKKAGGGEAAAASNDSTVTEDEVRGSEGVKDGIGLNSSLKELTSELDAAAALLQQPAWGRLTSSESEFSDCEGSGQSAKSHAHSVRVRMAALSCLATVCKLVDKRSMFGYWPFFIPDSAAAGNSPQVQTLLTSILKDPSPKCRMGALVSLTAMLDGTKQFLAAAEESSVARTSFTPLSSVLGAMIREMHRALLQALVVENYNLTLTQLIKCLATLVINVPYHRMQPGLLSRVVKQIRHFLSHKDSNVRVACLTCLGALVSHQPPLMEVFHIVQSPTPPVGMTTAASLASRLPPVLTANVQADSGIDTHSTSSPNSTTAEGTNANSGGSGPPIAPPTGSSGPGTPTLGASPGIHTPIFTDQVLQAQVHCTSWLIKLCIRNILPQPPAPPSSQGGGWGEETGGGAMVVEPLPVRLESLQVLATLTKGYFPIIRSQLRLMQDLIQRCLEDSDPIINLHGCKVLEELGTVMTKDIEDAQAAPSPPAQALNLQQGLQLWQSVLAGPLLSFLRQDRGNNPVRASASDCLSSIGPDIFPLLPEDHQTQCLQLVLAMTQCADRLVVSAAVRALGVLVLYPCLSKDVIFMADAANAILKCLSVPSVNVKTKAAWALGNLCDALVNNKDAGDQAFMDAFSDLLLSTMLTSANCATNDSDKVKGNAVRAVGNILRYLPSRSLGKSPTVEAVANSVQVLVKAMNMGPMKVRWNSCYAMANMLRNPLLLSGDTPWLGTALQALCTVVTDCKNFKVRINAALALATPSQRQHYGGIDLYVTVWASLLRSLITAEEIIDFAEFRYREGLTDQVCFAALHMLSLSEGGDVEALLTPLQTMGPTLQQHMHRFLAGDTAPGKVSAMASVRQRLAELSDGAEKSADLASGISLLREFCVLETGEEESEISPPRPTAFRQIYD